jgi:replication factor C subunit 1
VNVKANFKKPGADGMGLYRAVCLSGPPGIGKTTSAHLVANLEGYDILEYNASDTRNEKLLRVVLTSSVDAGKTGRNHRQYIHFGIHEE